MAQQDAVYATLVMTDSYLPGAMVLGHSLRERGAKARLVACVLLDRLSLDTVSELRTVYDDLVPVQQIINQTPANLYLMNRPDLASTFTKIELWRQTQYKRIVYLDADMVVLRAPNELLTMETDFAAVPDVGWPDCFNSGMMVLNPNMADYYSLLALASRGISFDGADQGLLNMHFTDWERLSFVYNCTPNANYQYVPAYKHFQSSINIIHFIGAEKPWIQGRDHKSSTSVYGELLARWWAVYDRHYRKPKPVSVNQFEPSQSKVHQYVQGEENNYQPFYQPPQPYQQQQEDRRRGSAGYQITQPQPQPIPGIHVTAPQDDTAPVERPFGDQPAFDEKIQQEGFQPTPTQEQRRWSAPHVEWDPARQPPPTASKPEAANFPSQQYEMSESQQLFEPPAKYPEPPKDMWYSVPESKPQPSAPPKAIFPWEERGPPKATRVFPKSREPTPPPPPQEAEPQSSIQPFAPDAAITSAAAAARRLSEKPRQPSLTETIERAFSQQAKPQTPPRHVFPWESRAPKPTRVFPSEKPPSPPPNTRTVTTDETGNIVRSELAKTVHGQVAQTQRPPGTTWDAFVQQTNKWDEDPDIARFMETFNKPRRAQIQVVHDSRSQSKDGPPPAKERRTSLKLTDFPTEVERPSLPVTPAPIRRPVYWEGDEQSSQNQSIMPAARGVPRQDEWVRRFTSQYLPEYPDPVLRDIDGVLHLTCQHCGRQNPIIKLEELQRRQSLVMTGQENLITGKETPPRREMPESKSQEEVIEAAMRSMSISQEKPKAPAKPILREPHFEVTDADEDKLGDEPIVAMAHMTATGSKSPTRFSPIVLEGEAASEKNSYDEAETSAYEESQERSTTAHQSTTTFDYSTSSLSPTESKTDFTGQEDVLSPKTTTMV